MVCGVGDQATGLRGIPIAGHDGEAVPGRELHDVSRVRLKEGLNHHRLCPLGAHVRERFLEVARAIDQHRLQLKPEMRGGVLEILHVWCGERIGLCAENSYARESRDDTEEKLQTLA